MAGADDLAGKTVIDACNPIGGGPPVNGVLSYFTATNDSLMERLQKANSRPRTSSRRSTASARRRWSIRNSPAARPTMFICGNDAEAKKTVARLLDQFGWETEDMGAVEAARAIEPLCMLWCIPGVGKRRLVAARVQAAALISGFPGQTRGPSRQYRARDAAIRPGGAPTPRCESRRRAASLVWRRRLTNPAPRSFSPTTSRECPTSALFPPWSAAGSPRPRCAWASSRFRAFP